MAPHQIHSREFSRICSCQYEASHPNHVWLRYPCVILVVNATMLSCFTAPDSQTASNRFTVSVLGHSVTGTEVIDFPAFPVVSAVTGCPNSALNGTAASDCPTEGGIRITITGQNFAATVDCKAARCICCCDVMLIAYSRPDWGHSVP
jgi:hypothetical protein